MTLQLLQHARLTRDTSFSSMTSCIWSTWGQPREVLRVVDMGAAARPRVLRVVDMGATAYRMAAAPRLVDMGGDRARSLSQNGNKTVLSLPFPHRSQLSVVGKHCQRLPRTAARGRLRAHF